jgi:ATP-dependent DNA ligase
MVIDNVVEKNSAGIPEQKAIPRYLVYDILTCDGKDVSTLPFSKRYDCIEVSIFELEIQIYL